MSKFGITAQPPVCPLCALRTGEDHCEKVLFFVLQGAYRKAIKSGGNRQYVTIGNIAGDDRVSLFLMDYPNRTRLKILGHAREVGHDDNVLERLSVSGNRARVERGQLVTIAAFDWNCPQHITPRYSIQEIEAMTEGRSGR